MPQMPSSAATEAPATKDQLFASFLLDRQSDMEIALPAEQVIEALPLTAPMQPLATGAPYVQGVLVLRGGVVPVINLKKRLGLTATDYSPDAKVAVVKAGDRRYGLLVDDIRSVLRVYPEWIERLDAFVLGESAVISTLIRPDHENRILAQLDLTRLLPVSATADEEQDPPRGERAEPRQTSAQFVLYSCRNQVYGVPVEDTREICFLHAIDRTFKSGLIEGAVQLRGLTIPVLCSAALLGCSTVELKPTEQTRILVIHAADLSFGLLVDTVHQIMSVTCDRILPMPGQGLPPFRGLIQAQPYGNILLLDVQQLVARQSEKITAMSRMQKDDEALAVETVTTHHVITEHCYLIFSIGKHYAIELKDVQEIIDCHDCLQVVDGTGLVQGVMNLRGRVVPVIGLRNFYHCQEQASASLEPRNDKLIIGRAGEALVALRVDEITTIYKQEQYHLTPSLRSELQTKQDTLDRLIEFAGSDGLQEHVLVVNVTNLLTNHLQIPIGPDTDGVPQWSGATPQIICTQGA